MKKFIILYVLFLMLANETNAQCPTSVLNPSSTPSSALNFPNKKPLPYVYVRESDVMWAKTIWRCIDLREKMNLPIYYPLEPKDCQKSLFDVVKTAVLAGNVTAYGKPLLDDEFNFPMSISEAGDKLKWIDTVYTDDLITGDLVPSPVPRELTAENIKRWWVKEVWFFDKQRSIMDVRIIGICPLTEKIDKTTGEFRGYEPLFWLYYPDLRDLLARAPVLMNVANTSGKISYDELFQKRIFESFIYKESNVYDRMIIDYAQGEGGLLESDTIKEEIFEMEHDLWQF